MSGTISELCYNLAVPTHNREGSAVLTRGYKQIHTLIVLDCPVVQVVLLSHLFC